MDIQQFLNDIKENLELSKTPEVNTTFESIDEWDSLTAMVLTNYINENFDKQFKASDLKPLKDIQSLISLIGNEKFSN